MLLLKGNYIEIGIILAVVILVCLFFFARTKFNKVIILAVDKTVEDNDGISYEEAVELIISKINSLLVIKFGKYKLTSVVTYVLKTKIFTNYIVKIVETDDQQEKINTITK